MKQQAANALAYWLLKTHPDLFTGLLKTAQGMRGMRGLGQDDVTLEDIGTSDIQAAAATLPDVTTDTSSPGFFSSLGSGIGSALTSVGSALTNPSVLNSFAGAAANYFKAQGTTAQAKAQTAVLNTQLQRAQVGLPPAPVSYTTNPVTGQLTPVYMPSPYQAIPAPVASGPVLGSPSGSPFGYAITPANVGSLAPNFLQQYGLWIAIGGAVLIGALLLSRR